MNRGERPRALSVLSWNVHGLPFRGDTPGRMARVATRITTEQPDIVLLQEVWLNRYRRLLRRHLESAYELVYAPRRFSRRPHGGLLVLLRRGSGWRFASERSFVRFVAKAPWYRLREADGVSGKGILNLQLLNGERSLLLTTTHLQAQYGARVYRHERRAQLEQLIQAIGPHGTQAHLIAGDFNTTADEQLYGSHLALLGDDLTSSARSASACGTHFDEHGVRSKWIDYLFGRNLPPDVDLVRIENEAPDVPYSDHDGLLVRWTFES